MRSATSKCTNCEANAAGDSFRSKATVLECEKAALGNAAADAAVVPPALGERSCDCAAGLCAAAGTDDDEADAAETAEEGRHVPCASSRCRIGHSSSIMCRSVTDRDDGTANPPNAEVLGAEATLLTPPAPAANDDKDVAAVDNEAEADSDGAFVVDDDVDDEGARGGFEPAPAPADETERSGSALAEIADGREDDADEVEDDALTLPPTVRAVALFETRGVSS